MNQSQLEQSLELLQDISRFCLEKEKDDTCRALYRVCSNFESTHTLLRLLHNGFNTLKFSVEGKTEKIDSCQQIGNLTVDQSRFTFVATISTLEYTAKDISLKDNLPIIKFLKEDRDRKDKPHYYLGDIMYASKKKGVISAADEKEWNFFINIRNALVHNNAIVDKELSCIIYGKLYSFEKDKEIHHRDIQSLFIFSKRAVELFYNWSKEYQKLF